MAEVINMPKLGFDMAEGTLVRWVKSEGDRIERGEVLAEIETDKATVEVESQASGTILKLLAEEGAVLPIGKPIAVVGESGEEVDVDALTGGASEESAEAEAQPAKEPRPAEASAEPAPAKQAPSSEPEPSGNGYPGGVKASPVARRLAEEKGLNLNQVAGSGPGGRIVKKDVEAAIEAGPSRAPAGAAFSGLQLSTEPRQTERVDVSRLRAAIGRRMTMAKQELPHFYVTTEVDAGPLMDLRRQANELLPDDQKLSVNDFIVKAAALALRQFPNLNASLEGDQIVRHGGINVGIAVAVEGGLLTVVVREADQKPIASISQESRTMAERARQGKVRPDDVEGSTFTVSNLGMFGVDHFIAIINPPEAAILATGSVRKVPVVEDEQVRIGQRLKVTISADHRVTDGAEAARWLEVFRQMIESPLRLML
ncbi:MAG TPA: dihydrolipoamide acetyltransferase family protein [Anaerolineales bacterium]|jgi:pyruvate dehydrogenase E2 component (dihydrolipoamide acetyltransferase)